MQILEIKRHILSDYRRENTESIDDATADVSRNNAFRSRYYAFTCLLWHPGISKLICGHTNFANDLLHAFDPKTGRFESLGYASFAEKYEIKVHRGLALGGDGSVYAATSCLHGIDERLAAPGGKVFKWDPKTGKFTLLCVPCPPDYLQTMSLDYKRGMIYGMSYPVFNFFAYSMKENRVVYSQYMGSITHIGEVDDDGGYWGTWGHEHWLWRYDATANAVKFFRHGLPSKCESLMYPNAGPIDGFVNGGDGYLYIGSEKCEIYRLNPRTAEITYLGKPLVSNRLPGLIAGDDSLLYGVGGNDNNVRVFTYDRRSRVFSDAVHVRDSASGECCFRPHDIVKVGDSLFLGETDNPRRSDCLWECRLGR